MRTKYVFPFHIFLRAIFRENQKSQGTRKKIEFFFSGDKTSLLVT